MSIMHHNMLMKSAQDAGIVPQLVASSTSTTVGITYPAGIQAGDLIVFLDRASSGNNPYPGEVIPAGYTKLSSDIAQSPANFNRQRVTVSYRVATGPLTGSFNGQNGAVAESKVIMVFRKTNGQPITSVTPVLVPSVKQEALLPSQPTITTAAGTFPAKTFIFSAATTQASGTTVMTQSVSPLPYGTVIPSNNMSALYCYTASSSPAMTFFQDSNKNPSITTAAGLTIT